MLEAETHVGVRSKMHNAACAKHRLRQAARIEKVAVDKREIAVAAC